MKVSTANLVGRREFGALLAEERTACASGLSFVSQSPRDPRGYLRVPVEACRPIAVQLLDVAGEILCDWELADILDVSDGGLCLVVVEDAELPMMKSLNMRLDVRAHQGFGVDVLCVKLRWYVRSCFALVFGVGFCPPLIAVPLLEPCKGEMGLRGAPPTFG
jgi:hypothetical protein